MKINIYTNGSGSPMEEEITNVVESALRSANLDAEIRFVHDANLIDERGLRTLPTVEVNGKIVVQGRLPRATEIAQAFPTWTCGVRPTDIL